MPPEIETTAEPGEALEPVTAPESTPEDQSTADPEIRKLRAESAKHRKALRETEGVRDQLQTRLDRYDSEAVSRISGEHLTDPADLLLVHELGEFRGEDGELDAQRVAKAAEKLAKDRPHWARVRPRVDSGAGVRKPVPREEGFGAALKRAAHGG